MTRWLVLCFALVLSLNVSAIEAVVNHTIFYVYEPGKKMAPYLELTIQIDPATVHFIQSRDSLWLARLKTNVALRGQDGLSKTDSFLLQTAPNASFEKASSQSIIDVRRYKLAEGRFVVNVELSEPIIAGNTFAYTDSFTVEIAPAGSPFYSGLQLLDTAYNSTWESAFQKNGRQQIPLSSNFVNDDRSLLHFYTELYQADKAIDSLLIQKAFISRRSGDAPILKLQHVDTLHAAPVLPFIGQFSIAALPSGNYYLNTILENGRGDILASRSLFFQRSNKNPVVAADTLPDTGMQKVNILDLSTTFIGKYSFAQVKAILKMMLPIASTVETRTINNFLSKPEDTYMRYFIYNFWKARNEKDPKKPWDEYTREVKEVNKLFGYGARAGYETERGIIYLKYGKPSERVIVANEAGSLPYEIWQYNSLERQGSGGSVLFYNPQNMINDFRVLHSTINQEGGNSAWRSQLYFGGSNPNARAELYFRNR